MTSKFTPGPWTRSPSKESGGSFIEHIDSDYVSHLVAFVHASHGMFEAPIATEEDEQNARLIAESPEMFELVKAIAHIGIDFGYGRFELDENHINKARKLVEKIEGES